MYQPAALLPILVASGPRELEHLQEKKPEEGENSSRNLAHFLELILLGEVAGLQAASGMTTEMRSGPGQVSKEQGTLPASFLGDSESG